MLPEPNETSQKDSLHRHHSGTSPASQHGFNHAHSRSPRRPRTDHGDSSQSGASDDTQSRTSSEASRSTSRRVIAQESRRGSPVDKISEHENAQVHSSRKSHRGPAFRVIQKPKSHTGKTNVGDFPNEVLTHILSHLSPSSLASVSLVSRRFYQLVTTPHAWRSAFSRFFPGSDAVNIQRAGNSTSVEDEAVSTSRRLFTRLTGRATWRSEYILRTRLLRGLARGKPLETASMGGPSAARGNAAPSANAQVTYNSNLLGPLSCIHANFAARLNKTHPRFIHGSDEIGMASTSDPRLAKVDYWGFQDTLAFRQFQDLFPGEALYGLGSGDTIGVPNSMAVSQSFGVIYGEGHTHESVLWFRHIEEKRGRPLLKTQPWEDLEIGMPRLPETQAITSVWIAKTPALPELSDGLIGTMAGFSSGVLTAYSVGTSGTRSPRLERGEITARWALCPGVPIIAIAVDDQLTNQRIQAHRVWIMVLNALGELYYLTDLPTSEHPDILQQAQPRYQIQQKVHRRAWLAGRTVQWKLVEATRRAARPDPYENCEVDGSYTPQSSSHRMHLSSDQITAETIEIESFLLKKPKDFQKSCLGWDMRLRLEVDFSASGKHRAGEIAVIIGCGLDDGHVPSIRRLVRCQSDDRTPVTHQSESRPEPQLQKNTAHRDENGTSLFGGSASADQISRDSSSLRASEQQPFDGLASDSIDDWRSSEMLSNGLKSSQITASAIDNSKFATVTSFEDPLKKTSASSSLNNVSSSNPLMKDLGLGQIDIPGDGARLLAIGTKGGNVLVFDVRSGASADVLTPNTIKPLRIINTDSPQVSCVALTSLYLVHGGNDGLVQAWDLLASTSTPIRTLNSRFSSRARRRLVQAEATPAGVGVNLFAAGAICLDPDPTMLRGMVSLGSHLRYWSYSSNGADQYKNNKRKPRRSERGSNQGADRFSGSSRGALKDYIANEKLDLEREKKDKQKEDEWLAGRFGIDLLGPGASEDDIMAYATMLSEEAAEDDAQRRESLSSRGDASSPPVTLEAPDEVDDDLAEAIQLSLQSPSSAADSGPSEVPFKVVRKTQAEHATDISSSFETDEDEDIHLAMQLSLVDQDNAEQMSKGKERQH